MHTSVYLFLLCCFTLVGWFYRGFGKPFYSCLVGKTVIVTGANTGIGYYTALDLAMRGARVVLACRNPELAAKARDEIQAATGNGNVTTATLDLASLSSVRSFARDFSMREARLDILVNNAGALLSGDVYTEDGLQATMQVNHFGPFLLSNLLLDKLKESAPSRIVNVTSIGAKYLTVDPQRINEYSKSVLMKDINTYSKAKLCTIITTSSMGEQLQGSGVSCNAIHPGIIATDIIRKWPKLFKTLMKLFFKKSEDGARGIIQLAVSKDLEGVTGQMFEGCQMVPMYKGALDDTLCAKVWQNSCELVGLKSGNLPRTYAN